MATGSDCCVTSIVSQTGNAQVLVAGCADGAIRLFDCRVPTRYSPVVVFQEHKDWIVNIGITAHDHQIVSCTLSGEVKFWDARKSISYRVPRSFSPRCLNLFQKLIVTRTRRTHCTHRTRTRTQTDVLDAYGGCDGLCGASLRADHRQRLAGPEDPRARL